MRDIQSNKCYYMCHHCTSIQKNIALIRELKEFLIVELNTKLKELAGYFHNFLDNTENCSHHFHCVVQGAAEKRAIIKPTLYLGKYNV
jgi:hypothetical protein